MQYGHRRWAQSYICSYLGDVVLYVMGEATKRNSRFDGFSVSSKDMIASVIFRFNGGFLNGGFFLLKAFAAST